MFISNIEQLTTAENSPMKNLLDLPMAKILKVSRKIAMMPNGCWHWQGGYGKKGYGHAYVSSISANQVLAHRLTYMLGVGPIPDGFDLHHRDSCEKRCVNPAHLTPLAHAAHTTLTHEDVPEKIKTHCKRGHEFTPETIWLNKRDGKKQCKICSETLRRARYKATHAGRTPITHCKNGHELTPENTATYMKNGREQRACRTCRAAAMRRFGKLNRSVLHARERVKEKVRSGNFNFTEVELASGSIHLPTDL